MSYLTQDQIAELPACKLNDGYATRAAEFFTSYYHCHTTSGVINDAARNQFKFYDEHFSAYYLHNGRFFVRFKATGEIVEYNPVMLWLHIRADIKNKKHSLIGSKFVADGGIDGTYARMVYQRQSIEPPKPKLTAEQFRSSKLARTKTLDDLLVELASATSIKTVQEITSTYTTTLSEDDEKVYKEMLEAEEVERKQLEALTLAFGEDKAKEILANLHSTGKF